MPYVPICNLERRTLLCSTGLTIALPTATLQKVGSLGRTTYLFHSFIDAYQPIYKGMEGDPGRVKWYAFDPQMSFNFALEALNDKSTRTAVETKQKNAGNPVRIVPMMDIYELKVDIPNLLLFSDMREGIWTLMGGQQPILELQPPCTPMEMAQEDPTIDPRSPPSELQVAKWLNSYTFEKEKTQPTGWIRLNNGTEIPKTVFPKRGKMLLEIGYELMLNLEGHDKVLQHVKRVELKLETAVDEQLNVNLTAPQGVA